MPAIILTNWCGEKGMPDAVASFRQGGKSLLDTIVAGIEPVERDSSVPYVGVGGAPNMRGELETDAAIMDGETLMTGAVGALKGYLNTIWLARQVLEVLPHTTIVGEGAALFAAERGAQSTPPMPERVAEEYRQWLESRVPPEVLVNWPNVPLAEYAWPKPDPKDKKGTVIYLARNQMGQIAGGTSTSGWGYKYPGRLGDSPIIGAGLYADSLHGACACTHTGEMTTRAGTARAVVAYMKAGADVQAACHEAVSDLRRLKGGYLGPVVIHAIDRDGNPYVVTTSKHDETYWVWTEEMASISPRKAVVDEIPLS